MEHHGGAPELAWVAEAAGNRLRAEVDGDVEAAGAAAQSLLEAATAAMNAGRSLSEITQAESRGKDQVREALRPDTLRRVERSGQRMHEAQTEHHQAIARAVRLGLSTRQIAVAAGVTHGTVRAITNRLATEPPAAQATDETPEWTAEPQPEHSWGDG